LHCRKVLIVRRQVNRQGTLLRMDWQAEAA
jgi:hypothetical protein